MAFQTLIRAGDLPRRLTFYTQTVSKSPTTGTETLTWTDEFCTVWGSMGPSGDPKAYDQNRFVQEEHGQTTIRYRKGIIATMQFEFQGRRFDVLNVLDVDERHIKMILTVREVH